MVMLVLFVDVGGMGFGEVVRKVVQARGPGDGVFAVAGAVFEPVESHVHSFGPL